LAFPVVTDPKKVLIAVRWLSDEIDRRYKIFARVGMRNITSFNARPPKKTLNELDDVAAAVSGGSEHDSAAETVAARIRVPREGDMLYLPPSTSRLIRAQGVLVTDDEIRELVDFVCGQGTPGFDTAMQERLQSSAGPAEDVSEEDEELVEKCLEIIRQEKKAS